MFSFAVIELLSFKTGMGITYNINCLYVIIKANVLSFCYSFFTTQFLYNIKAIFLEDFD